MKPYQQLRKEERFYIWQDRREGNTQKHIAEALGRHPSTICRELKRNTYAQCHRYTYHWALQMVKHRKLTDAIASDVQQLIRQYLSPEQVSGYLKTHHAMSLSQVKGSIRELYNLRVLYYIDVVRLGVYVDQLEGYEDIRMVM